MERRKLLKRKNGEEKTVEEKEWRGEKLFYRKNGEEKTVEE